MKLPPATKKFENPQSQYENIPSLRIPTGPACFVIPEIKHTRRCAKPMKSMKLRHILPCLFLWNLAGTDLHAQFQRRAATPPAPSEAVFNQPAENLMLIVADVQRHINDDVYKFPYPQDITGQNVFRAAIVKLSNYEKLYPGKNSDIVAITKAQCFEKLTAFKEAGANYEKAAKSSDADLKKLAADGFERTKEFSEVVDRVVDRNALRPFETEIKQKITDLGKLVDKYRSTPYGSLALIERERNQMRLAQFYVMFRFMQPFTTEMALTQLKENISANSDSKLRFNHHLLLGMFNYQLAREYTILNDPEGPDFSIKQFESFANPARAELEIVERADGFDEKMEARNLLSALDQFIERTREKAR